MLLIDGVGTNTIMRRTGKSKLTVPVTLHAAANDLTLEHVERGKQGGCALPLVFVDALLQFVARRPKGRISLAYASSPGIYHNSTRLPICETAAARPISGYGAYKLGRESPARAAGEAGGAATRFFNVYGVGQSRNRLMPGSSAFSPAAP